MKFRKRKCLTFVASCLLLISILFFCFQCYSVFYFRSFLKAIHIISDRVYTQPFVYPITTVSIIEKVRLTDSLNKSLRLKFVESRLIKKNDFVKAFIQVRNGILPIFVYDRNDLISSYLIKKWKWEDDWLENLEKYIIFHPQTQLLDMGCNVGVYTIFVAASLGKPVVAVDANPENTVRLAQSVLLNNLTDRVYVVNNALTNDKRGKFGIANIPNNIGGQFVFHNDVGHIDGIITDDLLPLLNRSLGVIIKLDIEGYEIEAILGSPLLFARFDVLAVLMEWTGMIVRQRAVHLISFLINRGYLPYADFFSHDPLILGLYNTWPYMVVWRRS